MTSLRSVIVHRMATFGDFWIWSTLLLHGVCMLHECIHGECVHEQHVRRTLTLTLTLTHTITAYSVSGNVVRVRILICATRQKPCRKRMYLWIHASLCALFFSAACTKRDSWSTRLCNLRNSRQACQLTRFELATPAFDRFTHQYSLRRLTLFGKALSFTHELSFFSFFFINPLRSAVAVDGHRMHSGGSVVGKASTIGIEISPTLP